MAVVGITQMLRRARAEGYAVPGLCTWNAETVRAVLQAAEEEQAPVILMSGADGFPLLPPSVVGPLSREYAEPLAIPVAIHLDHGDSLEMVAQCLDAGYTSVMLDASHLPLTQNVAVTRQAAEMAHAYGCDMEGELGAVGRADDLSAEGDRTATLTDPAEARVFVAETGVDALAISIGNAHGFYPGLPRLDFQRLAEIAARVDVPLVLHGGSGTPAPDLRRVFDLGIAKVNIASDLVRVFQDSLLQQWDNDSDRVWAPVALAQAMSPFRDVVKRWLRGTGAAGKAQT